MRMKRQIQLCNRRDKEREDYTTLMAELKKKNFLKLRRASPDHCILFRQTDTLNRSAPHPNTEKRRRYRVEGLLDGIFNIEKRVRKRAGKRRMAVPYGNLWRRGGVS